MQVCTFCQQYSFMVDMQGYVLLRAKPIGSISCLTQGTKYIEYYLNINEIILPES